MDVPFPLPQATGSGMAGKEGAERGRIYLMMVNTLGQPLGGENGH
jgi:hypothetical protein